MGSEVRVEETEATAEEEVDESHRRRARQVARALSTVPDGWTAARGAGIGRG